ncbi:MAG: carboxypeptidase-like regulatory domain-containing protein [Bacteroidales bacterium]
MEKLLFKHRIFFSIVFCSLFLCHVNTFAQVTISGKIVDNINKIGLSYVSLQIENSHFGTISNEEGSFILTIPDTIVNKHISFSCIGYKKATKSINEILADNIIGLDTVAYSLNEVEIAYYNENVLINLIQSAIKKRRNQNSGETQAKCLIKILTSDGNNPVELIEALGQGFLNPIDGLTGIRLKTGRAAYSYSTSEKFFNLDFTKTLSGLSIFKKYPSKQLFPLSVCNLSKAKVKKNYSFSVKEIQEYHSEEVMTIRCLVKTTTANYLNVDLSIGFNTQEIYSVTSYGYVSNNLLFTPLYEDHKIDSIYIKTTAVYKNHPDDLPSLKYLLIDYSLNYDDMQSIRKINSKMLVNLFDYQSAFYLSNAKFNDEDNDYTKLKFLHFDSVFWARNYFSAESNLEKEFKAYFSKNGSMINYDKSFCFNYLPEIDYPYIVWNQKQLNWTDLNTVPIDIAQSPNKSSSYKDRQFNSNLYNLDFQIYMDIYKTNNTTKVFSETVFSKNGSAYYLEKNNEAIEFINLYFDIYESTRNTISERIMSLKNVSVSTIDSVYNAEMNNLNLLIEDYRKEVNRGNDLSGMKKWSDLIQKNLSKPPQEIVIIND